MARRSPGATSSHHDQPSNVDRLAASRRREARRGRRRVARAPGGAAPGQSGGAGSLLPASGGPPPLWGRIWLIGTGGQERTELGGVGLVDEQERRRTGVVVDAPGYAEARSSLPPGMVVAPVASPRTQVREWARRPRGRHSTTAEPGRRRTRPRVAGVSIRPPAQAGRVTGFSAIANLRARRRARSRRSGQPMTISRSAMSSSTRSALARGPLCDSRAGLGGQGYVHRRSDDLLILLT